MKNVFPRCCAPAVPALRACVPAMVPACLLLPPASCLLLLCGCPVPNSSCLPAAHGPLPGAAAAPKGMMLAPLATTCCCIAALAAGAQPRPLLRGTRHFVKNTTHSVVQLTPILRSSSSLTGWATTLMDNAAARLKRVGSPVQPDEFWEFIPEFVGSARPGTTPSAL
eukprot:COSAG01_NODE_28328_length_663_cov_3.031915_1_plen_166_part_10